MVGQDLHNLIVTRLALAGGSKSADTNGATIDRQGYGSVEFIVHAVSMATGDGSNYFTFKLQEGDLANGNDMADVAAADRIGDLPVANGTDVADEISTVGYKGSKRYVRLVADETGTAAVTAGAVAVLSHARTLPAGS